MTDASERLTLDYEAALCPKRGTPKPLATVRALDLREVLDERNELIAVVREFAAQRTHFGGCLHCGGVVLANCTILHIDECLCERAEALLAKLGVLVEEVTDD